MTATPLRGIASAILVAAIFALFPRVFLLEVVNIPSASMAPTLEAGDLVVINRWVFAPACADAPLLPCRSPRRGDVVLFRAPPSGHRESFVKRVVAVSGQQVDFVDKRLLVDGAEAEEPWAWHNDPVLYPDAAFIPDQRRWRDQHGPTRVPRGSLFVAGDNRDESWDSRFWGPLPLTSVHGRPSWIIVRRDDDDRISARPLLVR